MNALTPTHPAPKRIHRWMAAGACGALLSAATALASEVLLEGFETSLDIVTAVGSRSAISTYTATGPDDANVTQGQKSLQVDLSGEEWWVEDLRFTFSAEASAKIREAAASPDVARYVLRYDVIFPPSGVTSWMSAQAYVNGVGWFNDQLDSPNGKATMSIALDLIGPDFLTNTLPEDPFTLRLADNFDATEDPFSKLTLYIDNFRLVDTYTPGAKVKVYVLQSFEDPANATGGAANFTGWGGGTRTTYAQHTASAADDVRVNDGTHSLRVDYANAGTWGSDFTIPFNGTKLADVLKLDLPAEERPTKEQLARYTFRFEVVYPPRADDWTGDWMNTSYNTQAAGFPWSQGGTLATVDTLGFRKTYSITLDQTSWADWTDPKPSLMFIANGVWGPTGTSIYYDNFRLIDTGEVQATQPKIDSITRNAQGKIVITWTGGGTLQSTPSLPAAQWNPVTGATSGTPIDPPATGNAFYRVLAP